MFSHKINLCRVKDRSSGGSDARTTKLYNRRNHPATLDDIERIRFCPWDFGSDSAGHQVTSPFVMKK